MKIIAGRFKKRNIFSIQGHNTRPTTAFFREYIFSVYQDLEGKKVIDLFAGTGALGLEALSRGAKFVHFVEMSNWALKALFANIEAFKCSDECSVHKKNVLSYLKKCEDKFDLFLIDPPYDKNLINKCIELIHDRDLLNPGGSVIIEHSKFEKIDERFHKYITYSQVKKLAALSILEFDDGEENENI
jgi:16S rRNA (guanine(966)-N(2))-methyltransferase RsmD